MQHNIEVTQDAIRCSLCSCSWKKEPVSECPGVRLYDYNSVPWEEMTTITQLKGKRLKPKDMSKPNGCYYRAKKHDYIYLYRIDEAIPIPELTEKQQAALEKATIALKAKYSCEKCGWYDRAHGQNKYSRIRLTSISGEEKRYCLDCIEDYEQQQGREALEQQMKDLLESDKPIAILDTETTGLPIHSHFQVVEISIIDKFGKVLFDSLIKPDCPIPAMATGVHGITDEMVLNAPTFSEIWPKLEEIFKQYTIYCYNVRFDLDAIIHSAHKAGIELPKGKKWTLTKWQCMMEAYAEYYGDWSEYHESYKWQQLASACQDLGVESSGYHRALGDVSNTLGVMKALAARVEKRKNGEVFEGVSRFREEVDEY